MAKVMVLNVDCDSDSTLEKDLNLMNFVRLHL